MNKLLMLGRQVRRVVLKLAMVMAIPLVVGACATSPPLNQPLAGQPTAFVEFYTDYLSGLGYLTYSVHNFDNVKVSLPASGWKADAPRRYAQSPGLHIYVVSVFNPTTKSDMEETIKVELPINTITRVRVTITPAMSRVGKGEPQMVPPTLKVAVEGAKTVAP